MSPKKVIITALSISALQTRRTWEAQNKEVKETLITVEPFIGLVAAAATIEKR